LLAFLVGARGRVNTVDVDPEIVERARPLFERTRLENVRVFLGDGRAGFPPHARYERLVAWASVERDVPSAWIDQVTVGGLIVAPLRQPEKRALKLRVLPRRQVVQEAEMPVGFIPYRASAASTGTRRRPPIVDLVCVPAPRCLRLPSSR
jgi:protein-L-isoaspartate(D-aspartate) O-methyltransferase